MKIERLLIKASKEMEQRRRRRDSSLHVEQLRNEFMMNVWNALQILPGQCKSSKYATYPPKVQVLPDARCAMSSSHGCDKMGLSRHWRRIRDGLMHVLTRCLMPSPQRHNLPNCVGSSSKSFELHAHPVGLIIEVSSIDKPLNLDSSLLI